MRKIFFKQRMYFGLLASLAWAHLLAQTSLKTSEQSNAGGVMQEDSMSVVAILGQPTPIGQAMSGSDTVFSGFIYTLEVAAPTIIALPSEEPIVERDLLIQARIIDETGIANVILNFRRSGDANFRQIVMTKSENVFQETIPASSVTSRGVEYFIVATNLRGLTTREPEAGIFSMQVKIPAPGVDKESTQPAGSEQSAYRLISVPLEIDNKNPGAILEDDLGSYRKPQWRFWELRADYLQLPSGVSIYTEFPNTSDMTVGKAFWLIVRNAGKIIDTGAGKSVLTNKEYPIALHPGWNFIGNPFNFVIPKTNIRLKSKGQAPVLRFFRGEWNNNPIIAPILEIQPFDGYAVFNDLSSIDILFINPDLTSSANSSPKASISTTNNQILWSICILAQCQEARDEDNIAAIVSGASSNWDELDQPEPPVIGEYVSVYFPHPEWAAPVGNKLAKSYCTDFRPMTSDVGLRTSDGETWPFEVKTNIRDKVNLTFEGLDEVPKELEVWLVDDALKITQNLRETKQYAVAGAEHVKQLKLVVGKHDFVDEKLAEARTIPTTYELSQNFPNPFNPATTIRYGLPKAERVTLKIYNLLGAEVATLVDNEQKPAGYHVAIWDGRDKDGRVVASGVYVYRMSAGSFVMTKKLALIK